MVLSKTAHHGQTREFETHTTRALAEAFQVVLTKIIMQVSYREKERGITSNLSLFK
jgi:hypothetical protein